MKRSPMKPGKPLRRLGGPLRASGLIPREKGRAKPLRASGARAEREADALAFFRRGVWIRCPDHCEHCGARGRPHPHHLVMRSRAPGWRFLHDPERNGMGLCFACHRKAHDLVPGFQQLIREPPTGWENDRA